MIFNTGLNWYSILIRDQIYALAYAGIIIAIAVQLTVYYYYVFAIKSSDSALVSTIRFSFLIKYIIQRTFVYIYMFPATRWKLNRVPSQNGFITFYLFLYPSHGMHRFCHAEWPPPSPSPLHTAPSQPRAKGHSELFNLSE